jgi:hypothetical protein
MATMGALVSLGATETATLALRTKQAEAAISKETVSNWQKDNPEATAADLEVMLKALEALKLEDWNLYLHVHDAKTALLSVLVQNKALKAPADGWWDAPTGIWPRIKRDDQSAEL